MTNTTAEVVLAYARADKVERRLEPVCAAACACRAAQRMGTRLVHAVRFDNSFFWNRTENKQDEASRRLGLKLSTMRSSVSRHRLNNK